MEFWGKGNLSKALDAHASEVVAGEDSIVMALMLRLASEVLQSFGDLWRHNKRGTNYVQVGLGSFQVSDKAFAALDGVEVVIYRSIDDGKTYVRPADEFYDAERFTELQVGLPQ
jgi:hypothetical protein